LDERRRQQAESAIAETKKKCPTFSADAVKAHLPKKPDLPPVVRPVRKQGVKKKGGKRSSDNRKNGVMPLEKQIEEKTTKKRSLDHEQRSKKEPDKKEYGTKLVSKMDSFRGGSDSANARERKPMSFKELMDLAKQQKQEGKAKEGLKMKETGKQVLSTSDIKRDLEPHNKHSKEVVRQKETHKGKSVLFKFKERPVCPQTVDKQTTLRTESTKPKCTVSSRTIVSSQHAGHNKRPEKRPRDASNEERNAKRLHIPVRKTDRHYAHGRKKRLEKEYEDMDFIDDSDAEDFDVSSHIKEIFGYDRHKYAFENPSVDAMESSYNEIMKEEKVR
jgi:protein SPT2